MGKRRRSLLQKLWAGWSNRCPDCGEGRIWNRGGEINDRCSNCGLILESDKADWGGFIWAFAVEGILIAIGIPLVELVTNLSFTTHVYLWLAFTVVFHVLFYKNLKGQWIALRTVMTGRPDNRV